MSNDIYLKGMTQEEGGVSMQLEGSPLHIIAASIIEQFKGIGADNYLEIKFNEKDTQELFTLTVQKASGMTPADKVAELTKELEFSNSRVSYYQGELYATSKVNREMRECCHKLVTSIVSNPDLVAEMISKSDLLHDALEKMITFLDKHDSVDAQIL